MHRRESSNYNRNEQRNNNYMEMQWNINENSHRNQSSHRSTFHPTNAESDTNVRSRDIDRYDRTNFDPSPPTGHSNRYGQKRSDNNDHRYDPYPKNVRSSRETTTFSNRNRNREKSFSRDDTRYSRDNSGSSRGDSRNYRDGRDSSHESRFPPDESRFLRDQTCFPPDKTRLSRGQTCFPPDESRFSRDQTSYPADEIRFSRDQTFLPADETRLSRDKTFPPDQTSFPREQIQFSREESHFSRDDHRDIYANPMPCDNDNRFESSRNLQDRQFDNRSTYSNDREWNNEQFNKYVERPKEVVGGYFETKGEARRCESPFDRRRDECGSEGSRYGREARDVEFNRANVSRYDEVQRCDAINRSGLEYRSPRSEYGMLDQRSSSYGYRSPDVSSYRQTHGPLNDRERSNEHRDTGSLSCKTQSHSNDSIYYSNEESNGRMPQFVPAIISQETKELMTSSFRRKRRNRKKARVQANAEKINGPYDVSLPQGQVFAPANSSKGVISPQMNTPKPAKTGERVLKSTVKNDNPSERLISARRSSYKRVQMAVSFVDYPTRTFTRPEFEWLKDQIKERMQRTGAISYDSMNYVSGTVQIVCPLVKSAHRFQALIERIGTVNGERITIGLFKQVTKAPVISVRYDRAIFDGNFYQAVAALEQQNAGLCVSSWRSCRDKKRRKRGDVSPIQTYNFRVDVATVKYVKEHGYSLRLGLGVCKVVVENQVKEGNKLSDFKLTKKQRKSVAWRLRLESRMELNAEQKRQGQKGPKKKKKVKKGNGNGSGMLRNVMPSFLGNHSQRT